MLGVKDGRDTYGIHFISIPPYELLTIAFKGILLKVILLNWHLAGNYLIWFLVYLIHVTL